MILVTGAAGNLGSSVLDHLLHNLSADNIIAFTTSQEKADLLNAKGFKTRIGNFDDPSSLEKAFEGVTKLLLISTRSPNRFEQQAGVVDAAKKAGVKHILYTSAVIRDIESSALQKFMQSHFQTEEYIKASGIQYTFLRNGLYTEVIPMYVGNNVFDRGIYLPAGDGKASYALRSEMAEATANVLIQQNHENKTFHLTGYAAYSFNDVAEALARISGIPVNYMDVSPESFVEQLHRFNLPEHVIMLTSGFAADTKAGQFNQVYSDLEDLLGREPKSLEEGLKLIYGM